jgi:hypothetical protein
MHLTTFVHSAGALAGTVVRAKLKVLLRHHITCSMVRHEGATAQGYWVAISNVAGLEEGVHRRSFLTQQGPSLI